MRIAVSSSSFRRPLASGELTQLEWVERCASDLGVDGVLAAFSDFARIDAEYVAQVRKVAVDLGLVPFGVDAPGMLDPAVAPDAAEAVLAAATGLGAAVIRTTLPPPGEVPPATFVEAVRAAKALSRAAKAANVTVILATAPGTIGADPAGVKHLIKDVDSAWLRACPSALLDPVQAGSRDRYPAVVATPADDAVAVAQRAARAWVILDAPVGDRPWELVAGAVVALRRADAQRVLATGSSGS